MLTLEQELADLDTKINQIREQREKTQDKTEKERLGRNITLLDVHERAAIRKNHEERAARRLAEEQAAQLFQQQRADKQEQADRAMLRRRWTGDDLSFEAAWPKLIEQLRIDRALGRVVDSVPAMRIEF